MTVAFDATFLLYLFGDPGSVAAPVDASGQPVQFVKERVAGLLDELQKADAVIVVAAPALSEIMVRAGVIAGQQYVSLMAHARVFKITPFDVRAAIETAAMQGHEMNGEGKKTATTATYAKLKYDRQIVAIAKVEGATTLYTDDLDQRRFAERHGLAVVGLGDLRIPAVDAQPDLFAIPEAQEYGIGED